MFGVLRSLCHTVRAQHEVRTLKPGIAQPGSADPICREQGKERLGPQAISQQGPVEIMDTSALRLPCEVGASRACSGSHAAPSHPPLQRRRPLCSAASSSAFAPRGRRALRTALLPGVETLRHTQRRRPPPHQVGVEARIRDPDAAVDADELGNRGPPSILVRLASALMYLVPWIDIIGLGRMMYHKFPATLLLYVIPGPLVGIYYSSQFAPLIVFFLLFLAIVKNNKLHHFVRFNCMQGVMLDIVSMLFTLLRTYIPAEIRWSYFLDLYDMFAWNICMSVLLYCVFFALWGKYADVPFISESVYLQVDASM